MRKENEVIVVLKKKAKGKNKTIHGDHEGIKEGHVSGGKNVEKDRIRKGEITDNVERKKAREGKRKRGDGEKTKGFENETGRKREGKTKYLRRISERTGERNARKSRKKNKRF